MPWRLKNSDPIPNIHCNADAAYSVFGDEICRNNMSKRISNEPYFKLQDDREYPGYYSFGANPGSRLVTVLEMLKYLKYEEDESVNNEHDK